MTTQPSESTVSRDAAAAAVLDELAADRSVATDLLWRAEYWAARFVRALDQTPAAELTPGVREDRERCRVHLTEIRAYLAGDLTLRRKES